MIDNNIYVNYYSSFFFFSFFVWKWIIQFKIIKILKKEEKIKINNSELVFLIYSLLICFFKCYF